MTELFTTDLGVVAGIVWEIIQDPGSRSTEAILVFGIVIGALLIALLLSLLFVTKRDTKDNSAEGVLPIAPQTEVAPQREDSTPQGPPRVRRGPLVSALIGIAVLAAWWVATGVTTSVSAVCLTCHTDTEHALTEVENDPHADVSCVRCHDGGTALRRYTAAMPARVAHLVSGAFETDSAGTYGFVGAASCASCHESDIAETSTNEVKAVRMSHTEPVAAGAACLDCHLVRDGVVGTVTTQMRPCLRCHNNADAPAECSYCHVGDIALAVASRTELSPETARVLVTNIECGGCHSQESCDACHGIRLPHTTEFMAYAHAREGVEDLWFNDGRTCAKCHYPGNRACTSCHRAKFLSHGTLFAPRHSLGTSSGCDSCHGVMAYREGRDYCVDLCHAPAQ